MKRILHLNLKAEYFDQIKQGTKTFEYREKTPYWAKRLEGRTYDEVHVKRGYPKRGDRSRIIKFPWRGFKDVRLRHQHFGDEPVPLYAIRVWRRLEA